MKKLLKKMRSKCGETLVEAIASILIFTFSSIILLSMISAATDINQAAKAADNAMREELYVAEAQAENPKPGTVTISVSVNGQPQPQPPIPVNFYYEGSGKLYTFAK